MYERAKYKAHTETEWQKIEDPVATLKRDGGNFFMPVGSDGSLRFFSRRQSVKGGFPERTAQLPHLTAVKLPQFAGNVYNVELIHTGHGTSSVEAPTRLAGILNSGVGTSLESQREHGPVRAVLHNVISPSMNTYKEKLLHLKEVEKAFGDRALLWVDDPVLGIGDIHKLIQATKAQGREGVVITSLSKPEDVNTQVKIVHRNHYNLRVVAMVEEIDKNKKPKGTMGALIVADSSGSVVGKVGTGFLREDRIDAMKNPDKWINRLIQVSARGYAKNALKGPAVYHGDADGDLDLVVPE